MSRKIAILGATGSIGKSTLDLVERSPERFEVVAVTAATNAEALAVIAALIYKLNAFEFCVGKAVPHPTEAHVIDNDRLSTVLVYSNLSDKFTDS